MWGDALQVNNTTIGVMSATRHPTGSPAAEARHQRAHSRTTSADPGRQRAEPGQPGAPGNRIVINAPPSGACEAYTAPPCRSAACFTIASPRPEPGNVRASDER